MHHCWFNGSIRSSKSSLFPVPKHRKNVTVDAKKPQPHHRQAPIHHVKTATASVAIVAPGMTAHQDRLAAPVLDLMRTSSHPASIAGCGEARCENYSG